MSYRETLVTTALLGTENQGLTALDSGGELGEWLTALLQQAATLGRERTVLHAAALIYTHQRAGSLLPKYDKEFPEIAPDENTPAISAAAAQHLLILSQFHYALLEEWFQLVLQSGRRLREELLAHALSLGAADPTLRDSVRKVVGERGKWLAKFNSDWRYVLLDTNVVDWNEFAEKWAVGSLDERIALLTIARKNDPAKALELVSSTWKEEGTESRAKFLFCLKVGLGMHDEVFLEETALNDKRKEVRIVSQRLLILIPDSRYQQRARARAFSAVQIYTPQPKGMTALNPLHKPKKAMEINIPPEPDKDMLRDGIVAKSTNAVLGDKAFLLLQLVAAIDPMDFCKQYEIEYDQLLDLAEKSEWMDAILNGLENGSIEFANSAAAKAHLARANCHDYDGLAGVLTAADKEEVLKLLFASNSNVPPSTGKQGEWIVMQAVLNHMGRWSPDFSKLLMLVLRNHLRINRGDVYSIDDLIKAVGTRIDINVIPEFQSVFGSMGSIPLVDKALETMFFRREMKQALQHD